MERPLTDRHTPSAAAGFTLLEVLIATAISGLIAAFLAQAIRLNTAAATQAEARFEHLSSLMDARRTLDHLIANAVPFADQGAPGGDVVAVAGTPDAFIFFTLPPPGSASGHPFAVSVGAHSAGQGIDLILSWSESLPEDVTVRGVSRRARRGAKDTVVLIEGTGGVRFEYYGQDGDLGRPVWHQAWAERPALPRLVRMTVDRVDGAADTFVFVPRLLIGRVCSPFEALIRCARGA